MANKTSLKEIRHKHGSKRRAVILAECALLAISSILSFAGCRRGEQKSDGSTDNIAAMSPSAAESGIGTVSEPDSSVYNYELVNRLTGLPFDSE